MPFPLLSARTVTLLATLVIAGCAKKDAGRTAARPAPLVQTAKAATRDLPVTLRAPVELRPLAQADVGSKQLGYLDAVLVDRGDRVRRGQPLALVRPSDLPDQLAAARGSLAQAQASAALARANHERALTLAPAAVVSQQELQQAAATLQAAEAAQVGAQAQIAALGVRLGETRIESPLNGVVLTRRLDPGALVGPATGAIVTVARTDVLRVFVQVVERHVRDLALGKDAWVEVDALPGKRFTGKVMRLAPSLDAATRTLDAEIQLPNENGELRPGMYGRAYIVLAVHERAVTVPLTAVQIANERRFAYVVAGGKVSRRAIEVGFEDDDVVEVVRGLQGGEEVVTAGIELVSDGASVRVAPSPSPAPATAHD